MDHACDFSDSNACVAVFADDQGLARDWNTSVATLLRNNSPRSNKGFTLTGIIGHSDDLKDSDGLAR
eukprot:6199750-Pleurochrysis_carterae.AAC.1